MAGTDPDGLCPSCGEPGRSGDACRERVCARRGYHFVATEFLAEDERDQDPMVGRHVDEYLVVGLLGAGGFGKVFTALQMPIRMKTALKLMHGQHDQTLAQRLLDKFQGEAQALAALTHPNIVRLLKYGIYEGDPYIVMEYVEGATTLQSVMARGRRTGERLSAPQAEHIIRQIADGLEAAHVQQIVHRDIKPENIMLQTVTGNPHFVRILDFGLAKFVDERTHTSVAMGTPIYMAPEQLTRRHLGAWTDWYALGVMAFELLTGAQPFAGCTQQEIIARKLDPAFDPLTVLREAKLPEEAKAFLRKALAAEPEARHRTADDFRQDMTAAFAAVSASGVLPSSLPAPVPGQAAPHPATLEMTSSGPIGAHAPFATELVDDDAEHRQSAPGESQRKLLLGGIAAAVVVLAVLLAVALGGGGPSAPETASLPGPAKEIAQEPAKAASPEPESPDVTQQAEVAASSQPEEPTEPARAPKDVEDNDAQDEKAEEKQAKGETAEKKKAADIEPAAEKKVEPPTDPPPDEPATNEPEAPTFAERVAALGAAAGLADGYYAVIPFGVYPLGCQPDDRKCWEDERPGHVASLGPFGVMRHEVTVKEYAACVDAAKCPAPPRSRGCDYSPGARGKRPIQCVSWDEAAAFCEYLDVRLPEEKRYGLKHRLPTEPEWEAAARGAKHPEFPWGDEALSCERTVVASTKGGCGSGSMLDVGSRKADRSWAGAFDMGGNVREWTASSYAAYPGGKVDAGTKGKVNRGGSWIMTPADASSAHTRMVDAPNERQPDLGFRCVVTEDKR